MEYIYIVLLYQFLYRTKNLATTRSMAFKRGIIILRCLFLLISW